jgi:hypothetical protein
MTDTVESEIRVEFERQHHGRNLTRHHLRGTYVSVQIAAIWNQHVRSVAWQAARARPSDSTDGQPVERAAISDAEIQEIFIRHGFKIQDGLSDLKPYVYEAARALLSTQSTDAWNVSKKAGEMSVSQSEIAKKLRTLSKHMQDVAVEMDYFGGFAPWSQHSAELLGASRVVVCWADEIEAAGAAKEPQ